VVAIRGPVLVLAPVAGDTDAVSHVLTQGGFSVRPCINILSFMDALGEDAGAVVIAEEALTEPGSVLRFTEALARQPNWSDLPVILLAGPDTNEDAAWALAQGLESVGNISILERPLRRSTLLNAVGVALRARARQHELREHKERLEGMVEERTAQLADSLRHLQAKERLAALGTLAAGLGHDISNLVLPIRMHLQVLETDCPIGLVPALPNERQRQRPWRSRFPSPEPSGSRPCCSRGWI
jgi:DNA-binding NtrC family response regulator